MNISHSPPIRLAVLFVFIMLTGSSAEAIPPPSFLLGTGLTFLEIFTLAASFFIQVYLVFLMRLRKPSLSFKGWQKVLILLVFVLSIGYNIYAFSIIEKLQNKRITEPLYYVSDQNRYLNIQPDKSLESNPEDWYRDIQNADLIDIRTPREYMAVTIKGAINIPEDEILKNPLVLKGRRVYLISDTVSRQGQAATKLKKMGIDARYLKYGIRDYVFLGNGFLLRPPLDSSLFSGKGLLDLTLMPRFLTTEPGWEWELEEPPMYCRKNMVNTSSYTETPGGYILWNADDLTAHAKRRQTTLVDVRPSALQKGTVISTDLYTWLDYPFYSSNNEYLKKTKVINIPVSTLTLKETGERIRQIQAGSDVIILCDDMVSGFEALWLGTELHRKGYRFVGRCTVPGDLYMPEIIRKTNTRKLEMFCIYIRNYIYDGVNTIIQKFMQHVLNMPLVEVPGGYIILIIILLFRLIFSPLLLHSYKQEIKAGKTIRHQSSFINPEQFSLGDRIQFIQGIYSKQRFDRFLEVFPGFVMFIIMLWLSATDRGECLEPFYSNCLIPDITGILPLAASILLLIVESRNPLYSPGKGSSITSFRFYIIPFAFSVAAFFVMQNVSVLFVFILTVNLSMSIPEFYIVRALINRKDNRKKLESADLQQPVPTVTEILDIACSKIPDSCGNKAKNLSLLKNAGFNVPSGFIITQELLTDLCSGGSQEKKARENLNTTLELYGFEKYIVRSSSVGEDGNDRSFAGIFLSVPNVDSCDVAEAVINVMKSYTRTKADIYGGEGSQSGGVIVQKMIPVVFRGVLFSMDPMDPSIGRIEAYPEIIGINNEERSKPLTIIYGRKSGNVLDSVEWGYSTSDFPVSDLIKLGKDTEKLFGVPQDVEWAYYENQIFILQSRNIIFSNEETKNAIIEEKQIILQGIPEVSETVWEFNRISEALPSPSPVSLSLFRKIWGEGGSVAAAWQTFGMPYNVSVSPNTLLVNIFGKLYVNVIEEKKLLNVDEPAFRVGKLLFGFLFPIAFRGYYREFRCCFVPDFVSYMAERESAGIPDSARLIPLIGEIAGVMINEHLPRIFRANIILEHAVQLLTEELKKYNIAIEEVMYNIKGKSNYASGIMKTDNADSSEFIKNYSYQSFNDYELSVPGFDENPGILNSISEESLSGSSFSSKPNNELLPESITERIPKGQRGRIIRTLNLISEYLEIKETGRYFAARETALLRKLLLETGRRLSLGNNIFYLELDEILAIDISSPQIYSLKSLAVKRRKRQDVLSVIKLPMFLKISDIESVGIRRQVGVPTDELSGQVVSCPTELTGTVRYGTDARNFSATGKDNILVTPMATTDWVVFMPSLKAIITESGGMLSHLAILAREMNIPYIAGVSGACESLQEGDTIIIYPDGRIRRKVNIEG